MRQIGLGAWLVDWLELVMAMHGSLVQEEQEVVEAFLYLMNRQETHELLSIADGSLGAIRGTVPHVLDAVAGDLAASPGRIDLSLVAAMVEGLDGYDSRCVARSGVLDGRGG